MGDPGPAPAFRSNRGALCFVAITCFFIALPWLASAAGWFPRERAYLDIPSTPTIAYFTDLHRIIFEEKGDIDILFSGSSFLHSAIDAPYLSEQFARRFNRNVTIRVLGFTFPGDDMRYASLRDLYARRRVKMLVVAPSLPWGFGLERPHALAKYWFDIVEHREILRGLPLWFKAAYYGEAILGAPRRLLSNLRPDLAPATAAGDFGSVLIHAGLYGRPFVPFAPTPPTLTARDLIHLWGARDHTIVSLYHPIEALNRRALTLAAEIARDNHTKLVALNIPYSRYDHALVEAADWSGLLGASTPLVGLRSDQLFAGMSTDEFDRLYWDRTARVAHRPGDPSQQTEYTGHWNANGSRLFTQAILPALIELYEHALQEH